MPLPTKLPSNIEAEKKVLAAAMTNRVSRVEIVASCTESDFFSPSNRTIFKAICDLDAKGIGADCVSVIDGLRSSGKLAAVGGEAYVIELISDDFAQASYEHYVDILRRDTARRNVIAATAEVTSLTNNPPIDTAEYISAVQDTFLAATEQSVPSDYKSMESALRLVLDSAEATRTGGATDHVKTGFSKLDELIGSFEPGQLIVLGARPAVGKSAFAINLATSIASVGTKVCLFSLEMTATEIGQRILASASAGASSGLTIGAIRDGLIKEGDRALAENIVASVSALPIDIDDTPGTTVASIRAKARRMLRGQGKGIIIVDYLQLVDDPKGSKFESRNVQIGKISRSLKILAKELNVPVIALSQLSRQVENRVGKVPQLSDLRESGSIEQDADIVMFLDRSADDREANMDGRPAKGIANVIVAKNRMGATGTVEFVFKPEYCRFYVAARNVAR